MLFDRTVYALRPGRKERLHGAAFGGDLPPGRIAKSGLEVLQRAGTEPVMRLELDQKLL